MRSKTEYIQVENERGKSEIRKIGTAPVQRDGMEYEFGVVFDLSLNHMVTVSKDRTSMFDGQTFVLSKQTGQMLKEWLDSGIDYEAIRQRKNALYQSYLEKCDGDKDLAMKAMIEVTQGRASKDWTESDMNSLEAALTA